MTARLLSEGVGVTQVHRRVLIVEIVRRLRQHLSLISAKRRQKLALVVRERVLMVIGVTAHGLDVARAEATSKDAIVGVAHNVL